MPNTSGDRTFHDVLQLRLSRRSLVRGGLVAAGLGLLGAGTRLGGLRPAAAQSPLLGFTGVPVSAADSLIVPPGYVARVLYAWGDPISDGPAFKPDASNSVAEQSRQAGMHHDGMHFFPLPAGRAGSSHGLLAVNHEYTDDGLLHPGGMDAWSADKVGKSQAAHGVSLIEVRLDGDRWTVVRPSRYARRITAATPIGLSGPAAGHAWLQTTADPTGRTALGTINNCASGHTPWGTYLTCEENFNAYFVNRSGNLPALQQRYGLNDRGLGYRWHEFDGRFDAALHPNEPNRFGWVVEIDPMDPGRRPLKRTAMGRFKHEGAALAVTSDRRVTFYMGDDERFEYVYKFVSRDPYVPDDRAANARVLDHGTLYVARFDADGTGEWLELTHGRNGLDAGAGFPTQAEVCVNTRGAADIAGATKMDRPSGSRCIRRPVRPIARSPTMPTGARDRVPRRTRPTRGPRTCTATSSAGASGAPTRRRRDSSGTCSCSAVTRRARARTGTATSRAISSAPRMGCGSTGAACCGSRPMYRPAHSTRGTTRAWATTRCWPRIRRRARCVAS